MTFSRNTLPPFLVALLSIIAVSAFVVFERDLKPTPNTIDTSTPERPVIKSLPPPPLPQQKEVTYHSLTLRTAHANDEISQSVGAENVDTVLRVNRINLQYLGTGSVLSIPDSFENYMDLSPFPFALSAAQTIPKLMLVSQKIQAFGIYEYGVLVTWGPVSTGKKSTPTPSELYFTNWKGRRVISSVSEDWIMEWYFNLDNAHGVSMHQYALPGYPASHACVRMFESDAEWIYNWADQWILQDKRTKIASGTPVIIFGTYAYGKTAPWKKLPENPKATTLSIDELTDLIEQYKDTIDAKAFEHAEVINAQKQEANVSSATN